MSTQSRISTLALAAALVTPIGCDDGSSPESPPQVLAFAPPVDLPEEPTSTPTFREYGAPWQYYMPYTMPEAHFEKLLALCPEIKKMSVTRSISGYDPEVGVDGPQVLGVCMSMMANPGLIDCLINRMVSDGAVEVEP